MNQHSFVVDVLHELIHHSFVSFIQSDEVEFVNEMMIEDCLISLNNSVVIINSHRAMIVRDRKGENLLMKLFFTLHSFVELNKSSYDDDHAVRVLMIDNVESRDVTLHLASKKRKVHSINCDEKEVIEDAVNERIKLLELLVDKGKSSEFNRVVRF